ncbi:variant erythrocyte surface antigen-1 family protein [Babesia caballi]|uniref:Variant erythrocyte surface antigen-1 family protein n=1 Tax=Babesia caballi TaxID=5871 RepID=A0AAV4LM21_BABCB|nr:variant erythrocyte surface antigen-1 family protein [Babesia caballi]
MVIAVTHSHLIQGVTMRRIPLSAPVDLSCDCPSNLKEAIGWILRVTGRDGQTPNNGGTDALTDEVKKLLEEVEESGSNLGLEFEKVKEALNTGLGGGLITKLAEGLQQFIGYTGSGRITGAGIAPSNIATHRLCDATIAFTIAVLERIIRNNKNVVKSLHDKYGQGPEKLQVVGEKMKSELTSSAFNGTGIDGFVDDIGKEFQKLATGVSNLQGQPANVAQKVGEYLKGVFNGTWGNDSGVTSKLTELVGKAKMNGDNNIYYPTVNGVSNLIDEVGKMLKPQNSRVKDALTTGKEEFVWHLEKAYVPYYTPSANWPSSNGDGQQKTCAQIFLGCIPLIYHCLTQLYWLCHDKGPWAGQRFHDPRGSALRNIMVALGYSDYYLNSQQGKIVVNSAMKGFSEFTSAKLEGPNAHLKTPYHAFLNTLTNNLNDAINPSSPNLTDQAIPALYHIARLYFRHQHGRNTQKPRPPSSIREMLYWLSGLQFSPQYDSLQSHISSVFRSLLRKPSVKDDAQLSLDVAESGATEDSNNKLSAVDLKGYLTMTCLYSPMVLGRLQGHGVSEESKEPYLHYLFGNGMDFAYPSGAALLSKLSEYAYALQFQLSFLTQQCFTHNGDGCGWRKCRSDHLASCSSNSMCHVPMGFKAECLRETPGYGYHVFYPLLLYSSDHTSPLRLLSDKLHCISNYTPRSLGDMLGFYLHLCLQVFNKRSVDLSQYITKLLKPQHPSRAGLLIFQYLEDSIVELGSALHGVVRHCHNRQTSDSHGQIKHQDVSGKQCSHPNSQSPADLWSLFTLVDYPSKNHKDCATGGGCGAYLSPLTRSKGSTFGKSAAFASTYLLWVSYLADDFKERLEGLLTDFRNITCTDCKPQNDGKCSCTKGQHGKNGCQCDSVVSCSGVLPLFYEHGFNFFNVKSLSGKVKGNSQTKRNCKAFADQLQTVITGDPLYKLLVAVDRFLYAIRWEFFFQTLRLLDHLHLPHTVHILLPA